MRHPCAEGLPDQRAAGAHDGRGFQRMFLALNLADQAAMLPVPDARLNEGRVISWPAPTTPRRRASVAQMGDPAGLSFRRVILARIAPHSITSNPRTSAPQVTQT